MSGRCIFNENEWEQFYYSEVQNPEAETYLKSEPIGTFLIRGCKSQPGAYVICIREQEGVSQYKINVSKDGTEYYLREESKFQSMLSLLGFYKRNLFLSSQLGLPIDPSKIPFLPGSEVRRRSGQTEKTERAVSQPSKSKFARVKQARVPSAYDETALKLDVGDIIQVTKDSISGQWEGVVIYPTNKAGKNGYFPYTHVEVLSDNELPPGAVANATGNSAD